MNEINMYWSSKVINNLGTVLKQYFFQYKYVNVEFVLSSESFYSTRDAHQSIFHVEVTATGIIFRKLCSTYT